MSDHQADDNDGDVGFRNNPFASNQDGDPDDGDSDVHWLLRAAAPSHDSGTASPAIPKRMLVQATPSPASHATSMADTSYGAGLTPQSPASPFVGGTPGSARKDRSAKVRLQDLLSPASAEESSTTGLSEIFAELPPVEPPKATPSPDDISSESTESKSTGEGSSEGAATTKNDASANPDADFLDGEKRVIDVPSDFAFFKAPHDGTRVRGAFVCTNYMIRFTPEPTSLPSALKHLPSTYFHVPLGMIKRLESVSNKSSSKRSVNKRESIRQHLLIHCKEGRSLKFGFSDMFHSAVTKVITQFAFPSQLRFVFAYYHRPSGIPAITEPDSGWRLYSMREDMVRLGVFTRAALAGETLAQHRLQFRIFDNSDFTVSPTYPAEIVVPRQMSDDDIRAVSSFRSKGRIPALAWMHPRTKATLWRSSQPRVGVSGNSCREDEALLRYVRCASTKHPPPPLLVADCRPKANAVANKAAGMGYARYRDTTLVFLHIHNIHAVRESWKKLTALCQSTSSPSQHFLADVDDTGWLTHIRAILEGAAMVANALDVGTSVLTHCSDGWDRTSQVIALAELMMDGYYRTTEGFCALIAKHWLSFGHRFLERLGHASEVWTNDHLSPIFLQFLDCVHQLLAWYPSRFQFSGRMLLAIAHHMHTCRFGTFLDNCDRDRAKEQTPRRTPSLFQYLLDRSSIFNNPYYKKEEVEAPIIPCKSMIRMATRLWADHFLNWSPLPALPRPHAIQAGLPGAGSGSGDAAGAALPDTYSSVLRELTADKNQFVTSSDRVDETLEGTRAKLKAALAKLRRAEAQLERLQAAADAAADPAGDGGAACGAGEGSGEAEEPQE